MFLLWALVNCGPELLELELRENINLLIALNYSQISHTIVRMGNETERGYPIS